MSFGDAVARLAARGGLVVQPRMGFADPARMRAGLAATRAARAATAGTITLDSYTRVNDHESVRLALHRGDALNGFPIVGHGPSVTGAMIDGIAAPDFPIQVRHGSADPRHIIAALLGAGLDATEGGPVSYCLPYSRTPLAQAVHNWARTCEALADARTAEREPHLETFGGCMMGQLCPPALLIALSVLEGLFFWQHGLRSISFSYAQQTNPAQDEESVAALHRLIGELLPQARSHVVIYTYMGVFPRTEAGALRLLAESARLAVRGGAARLIVKTTAEAFRIPTVAENVTALEYAATIARQELRATRPPQDTGVYDQARSIVDATLELSTDIGAALVGAFARGYLDVPYCLHPDNAGETRGYLDAAGNLRWKRIGSLPIRASADVVSARPMTSVELINSLSYVERTYDRIP
ncbi:methylaspartate mutase epsilon subunit [Allocatelliglobosispora scoriae]|uniref:Methylaspartate mutase epsilon subunit n=1 Tax=Allocatelliglobosispora scoriae TaxID=643052 RepID=A0A841BZ09_9ACTN|nr:methylaspartate mutase [Allocatelliglobosispora scoriae]MBB5872728.1 methylaspartate mutase epsilon subunit [Allocatelliglobosispora scoriae]